MVQFKEESKVLHGPRLEFSEKRGVGEVIFECMSKYSSQICQISSQNGEEETFASVHRRSIRVALAMVAKGIKAGDMISICSYNNMNTMLPYVAGTYLNTLMSFLDPTLPPQTTSYLLNLGQPKIIFCGPEAVELIENALEEISLSATLVVFGETEKYIQFSDFINSGISEVEEENFKPVVVQNNKDTCIVLFSSGTTGYPKGICLSHRMLLHQVAALRSNGYEITRVAHFTSFYWITGTLMCLKGLVAGYTRIIIPNFDPKTALQILQDYKPNFVFMANIYIQFIKTEPYEKFDLSHLKYLIVSGVTMTKELMTLTRKIFPHSHVFCCYGMTETGYLTFFNPNIHKEFMDTKINSAGKFTCNVDAKVVDVETNETVGPGVVGEWRLKSNNFMVGYYKQDSSAVWDEDGWLKTGDLGYYDEDECIFVVDRIKDLIKYQSWHVVPAMLEGVLLSNPKIQEAVVFGIPHEIDGDHPAAFVVLNAGIGEVSPEEISSYVSERVHEREQLRGGVKIVKQIPKTPTGKFIRRQMRQLYQNNEI